MTKLLISDPPETLQSLSGRKPARNWSKTTKITLGVFSGSSKNGFLRNVSNHLYEHFYDTMFPLKSKIKKKNSSLEIPRNGRKNEKIEHSWFYHQNTGSLLETFKTNRVGSHSRQYREDITIIILDTKLVPDFVLHACCFFIAGNRPVLMLLRSANSSISDESRAAKS